MRQNSLIPMNTLHSVDRGVGRMFDQLFQGFGLPQVVPVAPPLDLVETPEAYRLEVDLPGVHSSDVTISLEDGVLELQAERTQESRPEGEELRHGERTSLSFSRRLRLPRRVDEEAVKATLKDGVLTVLVPKAEEARPRRIEVQEG